MAQFAADGVPTTDGCRPVVLRVMADGEQQSLAQITDAVAEAMNLDEEVVSQTLSSGGSRLANRVGWACSSFTHAKLLTRPRRGQYVITENGREVAGRGLIEYSEHDMLEWPAWQAYQAELAERRSRTTDDHAAPVAPDTGSGEPDDPSEAIEASVRAWNATVETELRMLLQEASPEFFEKAVLELLWAMGYGGGHGSREHLGQTNDGGIDGVIRQDPLGLQKVYVQAKRFRDTNTVGSPDINGFFGALHRVGADRGVFLTTSRFSPQAQEAARQFGGRIVLVDGIRLTALMLRYGVGVQPAQRHTLFAVDRDFFDGIS